MRPRTAGSIAVLTLAPALAAGTLPKAFIPNEADYILHVDVEALIASPMESMLGGEFYVDDTRIDLNDLDIDVDQLHQMEDELDLELGRDVYGITFMGPATDDEADGVLLLEVNDRVDELLLQIAGDENVEVTRHRLQGSTVHRIDDGDETTYVHVRDHTTDGRRLAAITGEDHVMRHLLRHLNNLDEGPDGYVRNDLPDPYDNAIIYATASELDLDDETVSKVASLANGFLFQVYEASGGNMRAEAIVDTPTSENARDVADIMNGLLALGRLMSDDEPELATVCRASRVVQHGDDVQVVLEWKP